MSEPFELTRLTVGDVLERTITLLRKTFSRIGLVFLFVALPAALFFGVVMDGFLSAIVSVAQSAGTAAGPLEVLLQLAGWIGFLFIAAVVLLTVEMIALVAMQIIVCGELVGRLISTREAFDLTLSFRLWRALLQRILAELAVGLVIIIPYVGIVAAVMADMGAASVMLGVLAVVAGIYGVVYLKVRWAFGATTIAWEDQTVFGAFSRSSELVRGEALRTFAILALFAIMLAVFVSMIMSPLQLLLFKDLLFTGFDQARNVALQAQPDPLSILSGVGFLYGVILATSSLLTTTVKSIYLPVLYFDLRARRGEFDGE